MIQLLKGQDYSALYNNRHNMYSEEYVSTVCFSMFQQHVTEEGGHALYKKNVEPSMMKYDDSKKNFLAKVEKLKFSLTLKSTKIVLNLSPKGRYPPRLQQ